MPLLALFSKRNRSSSKVSTVAYSNSNISLNDEEYVSVVAPSVVSHHAQSSTPSSKLALPFRKKPGKTVSEDHSHSQYSDPLLDPPPLRSSLFQTYQDDQTSWSTRSLPDEAEHNFRSQHPSTSPLPGAIKRSIFSWSSTKERGKPVAPAKPGPTEADASFNLKSFRHVRPDSPSLRPSGTRAPSPAPALPPIPTTNFPSPPVSFQVTSRRPRAESFSELTIPGSPSLTSQQKMAAGAFRQAARRSSTSLTLTDSPRLSPIRTSLDDRPPVSLLPPSQTVADTPPRSQPPSSTYTPKSTTSDNQRPASLLPPSRDVEDNSPRPQPPSSTYTPKPTTSDEQRQLTLLSSSAVADITSRLHPPASPYTPKRTAAPFSSPVSPSYLKSGASPSPKPTSTPKLPRTRTNAFADSSSSSSSSEEDDDDESTSDAAVGSPRISRRRTIRQNKGQSQVATLPPLSSSVREQILRATPPVTSSSAVKDSFTTNDLLRPQSSLSVYGSGTRPRASLSVGALTPTAKETRASMALAANARMSNTTPHPPAHPFNSETSKSTGSGSDSEEDAPLSSLILPRRPGTSLSTHSTPSTVKKPLVNLDAPSTLTGRPVKAPPPCARDEEEQGKWKDNGFTAPRHRPPLAAAPQSTRNSQVPLSRDSWVSQGTSSNSRISQSPSSRTTTSYDTPSFSDTSGRLSSAAPNSGSGHRLNLTGNAHNISPVAPPMRPFARRDSPASSTGDSSSGRAPLTPRDESDTRSTHSKPSAMLTNKRRIGARERKASVTFEDEKGKGKQKDNTTMDEIRRRERRRSEARAAIELGNVVNGPPPVDEDDIAPSQQDVGMQGGWPQAGMQIPMQMQTPAIPPMFNMGMGMPTQGGYGMSYPPPLPNTDPAFLAAHQQAMAIAKQTFQYAVAQQALAAANDEWERSSTMTGYGGPGPAPQWGYGMGMRQSVMLPPAPRSMYAGSVGGASGGWGGTGSVYGNSFGPVAAGGRNSTYSQVDLSAGAHRPVRPRTKTAPSAASPPVGTPTGRIPAPPSSFRGIGR